MTDGTASQGQLGAGQQHPSASSSEPNKVAFAVRQIMARYDFMKPVKVVAVHPGQGSPPGPATVDVLPLVQQIDGNRNAVPHDTVYGLPVRRLQGGKWAVVCDPAVGDVGYAVCSDRDMSRVKATGASAPPGSLRKFSIADAVYEGGILGAVPAAYLWLRADGSFKISDAGGFVLESDGSGNATWTGNMAVRGSITATGEITRGLGGPDQVSVGTHGHPGNNLPPNPGS